MKNQLDNSGGPAFPLFADGPIASYGIEIDAGKKAQFHGMTLRQYAAIKLKVQDSGLDWLDEMIAKSLRDDFASKAMPVILGHLFNTGEKYENVYNIAAMAAYEQADALMKAKK